MRRHASPRGYRHQEPLYDTEIPTPSHAERARTLAGVIGTGTLCTLRDGHPYGSFVTYGLDGGSPVFLVSVLAEHTKNLSTDPRCSLLVSEPTAEDRFRLWRRLGLPSYVVVSRPSLEVVEEFYGVD